MTKTTDELEARRRQIDDGEVPLSTLRRVEVNRPGRPQATFALRLDPEVVAEIRRLAGERGVGPTQLVRAWVLDRLQTEHAIAKRTGRSDFDRFMFDAGSGSGALLTTALPYLLERCEELVQQVAARLASENERLGDRIVRAISAKVAQGTEAPAKAAGRKQATTARKAASAKKAARTVGAARRAAR